jgi:hypothetical protein
MWYQFIRIGNRKNIENVYLKQDMKPMENNELQFDFIVFLCIQLQCFVYYDRIADVFICNVDLVLYSG